MKYGMTESFILISMLIFGAGIKSFTTRMFKSNSGEPYAGKLHVRFLEEFISNCLIIKEGENLLMREIQADFDYFHTLYASKMDSISMDDKSLYEIVEKICKKYKLV